MRSRIVDSKGGVLFFVRSKKREARPLFLLFD